MTWALCFHCGQTKFGAICPCPKCNVASTGDIGLDIAFSDHNLSVATLESFGKVIEAIRRVCADDDQLHFWSFIRYISVNHSDILTAQQPADREVACDAVLTRAQPPSVVVTLSRSGHRKASEATTGDHPTASRPWWRFWRR